MSESPRSPGNDHCSTLALAFPRDPAQSPPVPPLRQFALPFPQTDHYDAAGFIPAPSNEAALAWLENPYAWPALRLLVHGPHGAGKTHLLHAFAARAHAALLPAHTLRRTEPPPPAPALAVDDADAAPDPRALLHLLNAAAERQTPVLLAATTPPAAFTTGLPDLDSRLRATTAVPIGLPGDALLQALLARLLADRQLRVSEKLQAYLLARLPRTGAALREAAARLDRLSLAHGKHINRAMAAAIADEMTEPETEEGPAEEPPSLLLSP